MSATDPGPRKWVRFVRYFAALAIVAVLAGTGFFLLWVHASNEARVARVAAARAEVATARARAIADCLNDTITARAKPAALVTVAQRDWAAADAAYTHVFNRIVNLPPARQVALRGEFFAALRRLDRASAALNVALRAQQQAQKNNPPGLC